MQKRTISYAILSALSRSKIFILKKWKSLNAIPFRVMIKQMSDYQSTSDNSAYLRLLIYDNEEYDDIDVSTNANMALFLQAFVSNQLKDCQILQ